MFLMFAHSNDLKSISMKSLEGEPLWIGVQEYFYLFILLESVLRGGHFGCFSFFLRLNAVKI